MKIRLWCVRGLPRGVEPRFSGAFDPEKVYAPVFGRIKNFRQRAHWQDKLCSPNFLELIENGALLHATQGIAFAVWRDFEIDPHTIGADFEFPVTTCRAGISLDEDFGDVPVPQLVAAAVGFAVFKNGERSVAAPKFQVQHVLGPENAHFRLAFCVFIFASPVVVETNWLREIPGSLKREASRVNRAGEFAGDNCGRFHAKHSITEMSRPADSLRTIVCTTAKRCKTPC